MKPIDLRAAGLSDDPADWDGVNAEPRPESATDIDPITAPIIPGDRWNGSAGGPTPSNEADETPSGDGWKDGRIANLSGLNWALGKMAEKDRLKAENSEVVAKEIARLREWEAEENEALEKSRRNLAAHVEAFARDNREALGKTRRLPNGVVAWRERKEGAYRLDPRMTDHAARKALLEWSIEEERNLDVEVPLTESKPVLDLERVKEYLTACAKSRGERPETPPGLEWVEPGESLSIVVGGKKP